MKKRILALAMAAVMIGFLAACSDSSGTDTKAAPTETEAPVSEGESEVKEESKAGGRDAANTSPSKEGAEGYELALVTGLGAIDDKFFNQGAWEELRKYVEGNNISCKYYQPQEGMTDSYLETIGLAIGGGTKLVVYPGFLFEEPIYLAQDKHPNVHLILLDGEPHGIDYGYKTNGSVMPILLQEGRAGLLAGYTVVKDSYTESGFMGDMVVPAVIRSEYDPVQGAEFTVEEDGTTGLEIMYNYTGVLSAMPEAQPVIVSWYRNGIEVIFECGGTVGNSVTVTAQEKNAKVVGMDVGQSTESGIVTTSAMKLLSNSVYDGVKDFYDDSFPENKTSMFTVANNGVGLPMDTSKSEKFSQEQYDAVYKRLADGEIGLVQFSANNNDPTKDLTNLTNAKVTFVEQGLAVIRVIQGPEMTCGR